MIHVILNRLYYICTCVDNTRHISNITIISIDPSIIVSVPQVTHRAALMEHVRTTCTSTS